MHHQLPRSPISGQKVLYIIRGFVPRSGSVIARALAGKEVYSEQLFHDFESAKNDARIYTESVIWCLESLKSVLSSDKKVAAVYNEFATTSAVHPYASLARDYGWVPFIVDCKTMDVGEEQKLHADEYRNRWENIWITQMK